MNERVVLFYYSDLEMPDSDKVALKCSAGMVADQSVRRSLGQRRGILVSDK